MTLPVADTIVTYPAGDLVARSRVLHVEPTADGRLAVITAATSCHPVDASWPDQPADRAVLRVGDAGSGAPDSAEIEVLDAVVGATDGEVLHLGADVPVRRGTEGWAFIVAHLVAADAQVAEGDEVEIEADAALRAELSAGHTACHVVSLALNRAFGGLWSKQWRTDALGAPDFDQAAIQSSTIVPNGSLDRYRLNSSLRRKGVAIAELPGVLDDAATAMTAQLADWISSGASVRIERSGDGLTDLREWVCELPDGTARIPCGGTHVASLAEFASIAPEFALVDDEGTPVLELRTRATRR
ncbi:metal-dependent hydrolase [Agromyces intestinalis]|uniref:Metal-dependent hydrolase n=1 Tax=Agromyces intestinalis TaxID=2592652 RepID=A0A5C1YIC5_9MICO|nr:metal-dependent hydrolase [Agromyces intestinalis]QEO15358.1 metal-dependent hydrolase [Agromyces intestinalis]